jgi:RNA polymerase sigma factor (sigma-70 family)
MPIQIALADDHQLVRKGIRLLLENIKGFQVIIEASDGQDLIDQIRKRETPPDLVLVDVNMPVMGGAETVQALRELYPDLKMVALSVDTDLPVIRELIRLGANAYLFKDSSPDVFRQVLLEVNEKGFSYSREVIDSLLLPEKNASRNSKERYLEKQMRELTSRELEFLKLCCSELTYKEVADQMGVSQRTVDGYRESLFDKLDIRSRTGLVLFAVNAGVYKPD